MTQTNPSPERSNAHVAPANQPTNPKDLVGLTKAPLRLVPPALSIFVAKVQELGAAKYGPYNWRGNSVRLTVYIEAALRHLAALLDGQDNDEESGLPHAAHAAACMGIILDAWHNGNLLDDRPLPGPASRLLAKFAEKKTVQQPHDCRPLGSMLTDSLGRLPCGCMPGVTYCSKCGGEE